MSPQSIRFAADLYGALAVKGYCSVSRGRSRAGVIEAHSGPLSVGLMFPRRDKLAMNEDIPLPFDLPAVARKKVSTAFDGGGSPRMAA